MRHEFFKKRNCSAQLILCLCLICFFISSVGLAQPYQSIFGEESSSWNVLKSSWRWTDSLTYTGDTVINGSEYKKVRRMVFDSSLFFLTEDTATGKVYYFTENDPGQKLILDMSLSVGDSLFIASPFINEFRTVDSVYHDSGRKHIRFDALSTHSLTQYKQLTFIEGIGSSFGLLYPDQNSLSIPVLLCAWQDDIQIYHDSLHDSCAYATLSFINEKDDDLSSIKVYPNPATDHIRISRPENPQPADYRIISISGNEVKTGKITSEDHVIKVSGLPSGVYLLVINNGEKQLTRKVMVK